jgi:hypothetical protein
VPVIRIGSTRALKCLDRGCAVAKPLVHLPEAEPGGGEVGRPLDRLREQIGGGLQIAARREVARMLITPIGDQVAGGEEERCRLSHCPDAVIPDGERSEPIREPDAKMCPSSRCARPG